MVNTIDKHPEGAPFSWVALQRDALPIIVVGLLTAVVSFSTAGEAYDQHWTSAWATISAIAVILAATRSIRLTHPMMWGIGMVILLVQASRGGHERWESLAMWIWLWTWIWTLPSENQFFWRGIKALPLFAAVIGGVMFLHALKSIWAGDWSHGASYDMTLPWAHRNIAMEALFAMCVLGGYISKARWIRWWVFITLLAFIYQVRGVMLGSTLWMLYALWKSDYAGPWLKRGFIGISVLFIAGQVAWNTVPYDVKFERFRKMPDVVKSLDIAYNFNGAESSSIRLKLWNLTAGHVTAFGEGLAKWRDDAEGFVNVTTGRCAEATRRAHSELLQWAYELGWLPLLLLIGLCWPLRHSMSRWLWFALPFLAFTFPTERAEILWPLAILGWWFKSQYPPAEEKAAPNPHLLTGIQALGCVLILSWVIAQNAIGETLRRSGQLKADWSPTQELCLKLHPKDIALNHVDVVRAMSEYNQGRPESGQSLIAGHLERNPLSIPAIRVLLKSQGKPHNEEAVCAYIRARIKQGTPQP